MMNPTLIIANTRWYVTSVERPCNQSQGKKYAAATFKVIVIEYRITDAGVLVKPKQDKVHEILYHDLYCVGWPCALQAGLTCQRPRV